MQVFPQEPDPSEDQKHVGDGWLVVVRVVGWWWWWGGVVLLVRWRWVVPTSCRLLLPGRHRGGLAQPTPG